MSKQQIFELIFKLVMFVIEAVGLFKLYRKMDEKEWMAFIPFFNEFALFKNTYNLKAFWIYMVCDLISTVLFGFENTVVNVIGLAFGVVVLVILIKFAKNFAASFGRGKGFALLTLLFPAVMYVYAGYSDKVQYIGNMSE